MRAREHPSSLYAILTVRLVMNGCHAHSPKRFISGERQCGEG